jgi:peptidoglycan/LPS O-acetylase OafA/YrhL
MGVLSPPDHTTEVSPAPATPFHSPLLSREMPGLDVLRGVAVLAVVCYHGLHWWLPPNLSLSPAANFLSMLTSPGWLGVNLFFVLSGFLITGILIDTRYRSNYWQSFYTRRALRILPLYVATLLLLHFYEHLTWMYVLVCLFYLANFTQYMKLEGYGPLWSLAVEEQFYLVWPFLVRCLRLRTLALVCLGSIFLSPILRYVSFAHIVPLGDSYTATWLLTDNLAVGALIAIILRTPSATLARVRKLTLTLGGLGLALFAIELHLNWMTRTNASGAALQPEPFLLLFAALLLLSLQYGGHPVVFRLTRPLRFFGYISYGLYLLHLIGFKIYQDLYSDIGHPVSVLTLSSILGRFCLVVGITSLICLISRRYFEEYFLRLKDRLVPYTSRANTSARHG